MGKEKADLIDKHYPFPGLCSRELKYIVTQTLPYTDVVSFHLFIFETVLCSPG